MEGDGLMGMAQAIYRANQSSPSDSSIGTCLLGIALGLMIAAAVIAAVIYYGPSHEDGKER